MLALSLFLFLLTLLNSQLNVDSINIHSAQGQGYLICPTPKGAKDSLQLLNCYITTPTPTAPPIPTPVPSPVIPTTTQPAGPTVTKYVDPCESQLTEYPAVKQALATQYKINIGGDPDPGWSKQVFATMCKLKSSATFTGMVTSQGPVTINYKEDICDNLKGVADMNSNSINITGNCDVNLNRGVLVHELTHIIQFRNPGVYNSFLNYVWPADIPTYNCQIHYGDGRTPMECFADGSAEYVMYNYLRLQYKGQPAGPATFPEYPSQHATYYNFFRDNVYGGVSF